MSPRYTDSQAVTPAYLCRQCAGELYPGERAYLWDNRQLCADCFRDVVAAWLSEAAHEVAQALGVESRVV